jgi:ABC-2 type transport system permease protein
MKRILDITLKDLMQLTRDFKTFMFLLIMPIVFTFLFGYAFGGFGGNDSDSRLPVGYLSQDDGWITQALFELLNESEVLRLDANTMRTPSDLEMLVSESDLAAAIIVPEDYGRAVLRNRTARLIVIADTATPAWTSIESEILTAISRLDGAVRTATIMEVIDADRIPFDYAFDLTLAAWEDPPISIRETTSLVVQEKDVRNPALAHTSPSMMLQFSIAGLLTAAQVIVSERKSRTLQRLLTTATRRIHVIFGHYLAIFLMIFTQFTLLILFGQIILEVNYLRVPLATLLIAICTALCIAALGLLIGVLAQTEEQAVSFSLIPMFVLSGLGGAWVPLEFTGPVFQTIGHLSPVAWGLDGFENICARGLGFESVLGPAAALIGYAILFFTLAAWKMNRTQET